MALTVFSLTATPPARFDDLAWVDGRIQQADTETGTYALLETVALDPVDTDPSQPATRSFTTELATVGKWYRIVFADEDGDLSEPSDPVENASGTAAYATAAELATILKVNETTFSDALERVLLASAGEINSEIGRSDLAGWELALAKQVNLERATDHWRATELKFGVVPVGADFGIRALRDTWETHAIKLAPLKRSWGLA